MNKRDPFWMVYVEGGQAPAIKHATRGQALEEANRLAQKERRAAFVLQAVGGVKPAEGTEPIVIAGESEQ